MRICVVTHVPFEGPETIAEWAAERGHTLTRMSAITEEFPSPSAIDLAVVMGGPMSADDETASPWLVAEKAWLRQVLEAGGGVFGVCLGAQILAAALGAPVGRNPVPEIGWFPLTLTPTGELDPIFSKFPDGLVVGHWHGDTFGVPGGPGPALSSAACTNQAFSAAGGRAVGVQFHLEWTPESLAELVAECPDDLVGEASSVMDAEALLAGCAENAAGCRDALFGVLDRLAARIGRSG